MGQVNGRCKSEIVYKKYGWKIWVVYPALTLEVFAMLRTMLKGKIHRATVTDANLNYEGSISIDTELLKMADILIGEKVQVVNINNGERFETYTIPGGKGEICLNGAAARRVHKGDKVIIISYALMDEGEVEGFSPKVVMVDDKNCPAG
jgi:aspartate 1-decarboxylase